MNNDHPNAILTRFLGLPRFHRQTLQVLFALTVTALMVSGCTINYRAGNLPNIEALEHTLKLGVSTENDVSRILGEPFGQGREMLPFHQASRPMWSYYYEQGHMTLSGSGDGRRVFLFVFFKQGRYDGYMWFSSLPEHRAKPL